MDVLLAKLISAGTAQMENAQSFLEMGSESSHTKNAMMGIWIMFLTGVQLL